MKFIVLIAAFGLAIIPKSNSQETGTCGGTPDNFDGWSLHVDPYPIVGGSLSLTFILNVKNPVPVGSKLIVDIEAGSFGKIPCTPLDIWGGISLGSCEYDIDELLAKIPPKQCSRQLPAGQECKLPLNAGSYGGKIIKFHVPNVAVDVLKMLNVKKSDVTATVVQPDGREWGCVSATLEIK